jgi:hypothetical protein
MLSAPQARVAIALCKLKKSANSFDILKAHLFLLFKKVADLG